MIVLNKELKTIDNVAEIITLADLHIGSHECNETLVKGIIDYVLEKENRYVILNGDIVNNPTKNSIGSIYEDDMSPLESIAIATKYLLPLVEQKRILCYCGGNHDHGRSMKDVGISPALMLADRLGLNDSFSGESIFMFAKIIPEQKKDKVSVYNIFLAHGENGGGASIGGKANALDKMKLIVPQADVIIHSHTHAPLTFKDEYIEVNNAKQIITPKERLFVNTNATLNYGGYGERKLYPIASRCFPKIFLSSVRYRQNYNDRIIKTMWCEL